MDTRVAQNIIKLLDDVTIKGHKSRQVMNEACDQLMEIVNFVPPKEDDGKTDTE